MGMPSRRAALISFLCDFWVVSDDTLRAPSRFLPTLTDGIVGTQPVLTSAAGPKASDGAAALRLHLALQQSDARADLGPLPENVSVLALARATRRQRAPAPAA